MGPPDTGQAWLADASLSLGRTSASARAGSGGRRAANGCGVESRGPRPSPSPLPRGGGASGGVGCRGCYSPVPVRDIRPEASAPSRLRCGLASFASRPGLNARQNAATGGTLEMAFRSAAFSPHTAEHAQRRAQRGRNASESSMVCALSAPTPSSDARAPVNSSIRRTYARTAAGSASNVRQRDRSPDQPSKDS